MFLPVLLTFIALTTQGGFCNRLVEMDMEKEDIITTRIAGGDNASLCEVNYQASIQKLIDPELERYLHHCGAAIISLGTILTSATCMYDENGLLDPSELRVLSEITSVNFTFFAQRRFIANYTIHPDFSPTDGFDNNLAVIRLERPYYEGSYLSPIALRTERSDTGEYCTVSGYGSDDYDKPIQTFLTRAIVSVTDQAACVELYDELSQYPITDNMMCAGANKRNFCWGDFGGPLVCNGRLAGIASFGLGCGEENYSNAYTEVSKYIDWIENEIL